MNFVISSSSRCSWASVERMSLHIVIVFSLISHAESIMKGLSSDKSLANTSRRGFSKNQLPKVGRSKSWRNRNIFREPAFRTLHTVQAKIPHDMSSSTPSSRSAYKVTTFLNYSTKSVFLRQGQKRRRKYTSSSRSMKSSAKGYVYYYKTTSSSRKSSGKGYIYYYRTKSSRSKGKGIESEYGSSSKGKGYGHGYHPYKRAPSRAPTLQLTSEPTLPMARTHRPTRSPRTRPSSNANPPTVLRDFSCEVSPTGLVGRDNGELTYIDFYYRVETTSGVTPEELDGELLQKLEHGILQAMIPYVFPEEECNGSYLARQRQQQRQRQGQRERQRQREQFQRRLQAKEGIIIGLSSRPPDFVVYGMECAGSYNDPCYVISGAISIYSEGMSQNDAVDTIEEAIYKTMQNERLHNQITWLNSIIMLNNDLEPFQDGTPTLSPTVHEIIPTFSSLQPTNIPITPVPGAINGVPSGSNDVDTSDRTGFAFVPIWGWVLVALGVLFLILCCIFVGKMVYKIMITVDSRYDDDQSPDESSSSEEEQSGFVGYVPPPTIHEGSNEGTTSGDESGAVEPVG